MNDPKARPRTTAEVLAQQKADARERVLKTSPAAPPPNGNAVVVAAKTSTSLAPLDNRSPLQAYLDEVAPVTAMVGRQIKFTKGEFITPDDEKEVEDGAEFVAHCDQALVGWIKFNGPGNPPDRNMGMPFDGYVMPSRASLGDDDEALWEMGLDGKPADPWNHQVALPMQRTGTLEMFTFTTSSPTGRRAVGQLLRHYERMQRVNPNELPVVRLQKGGFQHKDSRVGFVATPVFAVIGRAPRDSAAIPDTLPSADLNDEIPAHLR